MKVRAFMDSPFILLPCSTERILGEPAIRFSRCPPTVTEAVNGKPTPQLFQHLQESDRNFFVSRVIMPLNKKWGGSP